MNNNKQILTDLLFIAIFMIIGMQGAIAQQFTQVIKGNITDVDSRFSVIGANVYIAGSEPILGAATDIDGNFKIEKVPVGRVTIIVTSIGYEERVIPNVVVGSAKEVIINVELKESLVKLDEVIVRDREKLGEAGNEMVLVSGRYFSVEETERYAGTINDPARAVTSFAGVQGNPEGNNDIIVRGNSPNTVQWRMEGIEIPNPNHFSEEGSQGGAINILNSAMLTNSDFYTGAFTSDYGNVLGSVFDMKMRTGNREKREYSFGIGIIGTDITLEGPFVKGGNSSYLANYRYSTIELLDKAGFLDFGGVPRYQDLSFKLNFPTKKAGQFTVFGIGGKSGIRDESIDDQTNEVLSKDDFGSYMGALNLQHIYFITPNTSLESYVGISGNGSTYDFEELNDEEVFENTYTDELNKTTYRAGTMFNSKVNARHTLRAGTSLQYFKFNFFQRFLNSDDEWETGLDDAQHASMFRSFINWKFRITEDLTFNSGLNYQKFSLNNEHRFEPRASVRYQLNEHQSIFGGVGFHSQMAPLPIYFSMVDGYDVNRPNIDLEFMKAIHYVVGYDWILGRNLYFKSEIYYQQLYDIPVAVDEDDPYSLVNAVSGFTDKALVNKGTGTNFGLELTLERFFNNQYYFLATGSFYESKYEALDNVERNSRFNGNYALNFLFGKEFYIKHNKNKVFSINSRLNYAGGFRFTELMLEESMESGEGIYDTANPFSRRGDAIFKLDLSASYSWNKKSVRQELKLEVQNLTNNQAVTYEYYNDDTGEKEVVNQLPMFPVVTYTIQF